MLLHAVARTIPKARARTIAGMLALDAAAGALVTHLRNPDYQTEFVPYFPRDLGERS